jgi:hypothetical protein
MEVIEQRHTSIALDVCPVVKRVCISLPDATKEVTIGADLDPKQELVLTSFF